MSKHCKAFAERVCSYKETASDPSIIPFLIGAGIRTLSVQISVISAVRKEIETRSLEQDIELVEEFLRNSFPGGEAPLRMSACYQI